MVFAMVSGGVCHGFRPLALAMVSAPPPAKRMPSTGPSPRLAKSPSASMRKGSSTSPTLVVGSSKTESARKRLDSTRLSAAMVQRWFRLSSEAFPALAPPTLQLQQPAATASCNSSCYSSCNSTDAGPGRQRTTPPYPGSTTKRVQHLSHGTAAQGRAAVRDMRCYRFPKLFHSNCHHGQERQGQGRQEQGGRMGTRGQTSHIWGS